METIKWNKLRVLVTNRCNYNCSFCHNEGQNKTVPCDFMSEDKFKLLVDYLEGQNLSEINFSGGEPFLHQRIVDMITYANDHTTSDISCATNLSLITDEQISMLSNTRLKFNIQFPFVDEDEFQMSTGNGRLNHILTNINKVRAAGLKIGLNTVIQSDNFNAIYKVIQFAISNELPIKLLPQIGLPGSERFIDGISRILQQYSVSFVDKGTGALRWTLQRNGHKTSVLYIESPCFAKDITTCRNYGEIRLLPDFRLQSCILKDQGTEPLSLEKGKDYVIKQFDHQWINFNHC